MPRVLSHLMKEERRLLIVVCGVRLGKIHVEPPIIISGFYNVISGFLWSLRGTWHRDHRDVMNVYGRRTVVVVDIDDDAAFMTKSSVFEVPGERGRQNTAASPQSQITT